MAQSSSTGTVSGTVTDTSGAAVPRADVSLTDAATGSARTTTTNDTGGFVFPYVNPGTYNVKISKQGFKTVVVANQPVEVGRQLSVNPVLEIGSVSQTVEVTVTVGAELQTMDATVGATLSGTTLVNLPNTSRDASTLAVLQPGQNINGNVGGAASDQNSFLVDGGYATDDMSGDNNTYISGFGSDTAGGTGMLHSAGFNQTPSAVIPLPVASVEEFKVSTANQTADFNGGAGSQIEIVTKRGTNALHGGLYEYYESSTFGGANTWDDNLIGKPIVSSHFSRFGADAGGKIPHANFLGGDWFMFGLYEGYRFPQAVAFTRTMPLPSMRAGLIHLNGQTINLNPFPVVDPGCGAAAAANCKITTTGQTIQPTVCPVGSSASNPNSLCDPRLLGTTTNGQANGPLNPVVTLWNTYLPMPNNCNSGDGLNYCGYTGSIAIPESSNFGVARIDHDFAKGWHFNGTYHYYKLTNTVDNQWDLGGFFPGDTKGQYAAIRQKPQNSWLYTAGLTKAITPSVTNDFHFSYTRNWWAYLSPSGVPNVAGYPAALEVGGENSNNVFIPYNTNNQSVRTRYWDGHDYMLRDDVSWVRGSHYFQFGGTYQRNVDAHKRNDNGGSINTYEQYLIGEGNSVGLSSVGVDMSGYVPTGITSGAKYGNLYSEILGMVDSSQGLFSRGLGTQSLPLNPITSCAIPGVAATAGCLSSPPITGRSILPTYSLYWTDSWRMRPRLTLNYGLGYTIEMPPYETTGGVQSVMVDGTGHIFRAEDFFQKEKQLALNGIADAPDVGFAAVRNVVGHSKYPYDPFYGGISPRVGIAWNFRKDTVVRGGYARIFGRINGVNPLLVPLLTPGLLQPDTCGGPNISGGCGSNPSSAFRVGVDGTNAPLPPPSVNLPQPWYPGVNDVATGAGETVDPNFKPNQSDEFTVTIQHQFGPKILAEAGYIGRKISNEIEYYSLTAVPYMLTLKGQTFANAWKNVMVGTNYSLNVPAPKICTANCSTGNPTMGPNPAYYSYLNGLPTQPWFEAALGGASSSYCTGNSPGLVTGMTSCTAAFVANNAQNGGNGLMLLDDPFDAWGGISNSGFFTFGRTFTSDPINSAFGANGQAPSVITTVSNGYGNYNAGFLQLTLTEWHGLTMKTNFTMSKALGTGNVVQATSSFATIDPWNLHAQYGPQSYDEKFNFNLFFNYAPPFYASQKGIIGHLLGGWNISPLFVYGSGFPVQLQTANGNCGSLGECNTAYIGANENMVGNVSFNATRHQNTYGSVCGTSGPGQNILANPDASCPASGGTFSDLVRGPILGLDGQSGAFPVRGFPFWNLDLGISKRIKMTERFSGTLHFDSSNTLNHMQPNEPCFSGAAPQSWGVIGSSDCSNLNGNVQGNLPRRLQFGITVDF